ncbi:MAG TPA: hypothetical protein VMU88_03800, partial [bacterium]|nr:hypothetical protein [bacterium]
MGLLLLAARLGAQSVSPSPLASPGPAFSPAQPPPSTPTPSATVTPTSTDNPFATPTYTWTWDPWSTNTATPTPNFFSLNQSPTATWTPIMTSTYTPTGTLTPPDTATPTITDTPSISRSGLALLPTAYSNGLFNSDDWNWDLSFSYFIGSIAEHQKGEANTDFLNPLRLWLLSSDLKYGWVEEDGDMPGLASGLMLSMLISGGANNNAGAGQGASSFQLSGTSMGGFYTVASKALDKDSALHAGMVFGLRQPFSQLGISDFAPSMTYGDLLPMFTAKLSDDLSRRPEYLF